MHGVSKIHSFEIHVNCAEFAKDMLITIRSTFLAASVQCAQRHTDSEHAVLSAHLSYLLCILCTL